MHIGSLDERTRGQRARRGPALRAIRDGRRCGRQDILRRQRPRGVDRVGSRVVSVGHRHHRVPLGGGPHEHPRTHASPRGSRRRRLPGGRGRARSERLRLDVQPDSRPGGGQCAIDGSIHRHHYNRFTGRGEDGTPVRPDAPRRRKSEARATGQANLGSVAEIFPPALQRHRVMAQAPGTPKDCLHLPNLIISGFRGIDHLAIPRLGRVTLLAGKNGVGKTTVLDAARVYAGRGHPMVLMDLLRDHEELSTAVGEDGDEVLSPDIAALFFGRNVWQRRPISIGPEDDEHRLQIEVSQFDEIPFNVTMSVDAPLLDYRAAGLKIRLQEKEWSISSAILNRLLPINARLRRVQLRLGDQNAKWPAEIECGSLGPGLPNDTDVVRYWDRIALTDRESQPLRGLQLILGRSVDRIAVVGDDGLRGATTGRRVIPAASGRAASGSSKKSR